MLDFWGADMIGIGVPGLDEAIKSVEGLTGHELPAAVRGAIGYAALLAIVLGVVAIIAVTAVKIRDAWTGHLRPRAYSPEQRQRAEVRRQFAQYLVDEIRQRNRTENWRDQQYAELEAEVEAEGRRRSWFPLMGYRRGVRREKSLSAALRHSRERLILVEGEPGSGKSVALRHIALKLSTRASHSRRLDSKLPVYVNLKDLKRQRDEPIDAALIRRHVIRTLRKATDIFVDEFIDMEFDNGLRDGSWIFLFDSFDEIPEVLSAIEADQVTMAYSGAISEFLSGMKKCRAIVASRSYRGPRNVGWNTFLILDLSLERQRQLIRKSLLSKPGFAQRVEAELALGGEDMRKLAENPMLLGLLCEHVRADLPFPKNSYELLSTYIAYRLEHDADRVRGRFGLEPEIVAATAEAAAFAMTSDSSFGLTPPLAELEVAILRQENGDSTVVRKGLNALVYMRLARAEGEEEVDRKEFTFAHRRFQEYFATKALLGGGKKVSPRDLLTNARWREAAVVLLQHEGPIVTQPLLQKARDLLAAAAEELSIIPGERGDASLAGMERDWRWPPKILHIISILHAGARHNPDIIRGELSELVGAFVLSAFERGDMLDAKLALDVAGPAPEPILLRVMKIALAADSQWLNDAVYWQASRLSEADPEILSAIRHSIVSQAASGKLRHSYLPSEVYLSRLPESATLLRALRLAYWGSTFETATLAAICIACATISRQAAALALGAFIIVVVADLFWRRHRHFLFEIGTRLSRFVAAVMLTFAWTDDFSSSGGTSADRAARLGNTQDLLALYGDTLSRAANNFGFTFLLIWWLTWRLSSFRTIESGRFLSPLYWPFLPFLRLLPAKRIRDIKISDVVELITVFFGGLAVIGILILLIYGVIVLAKAYSDMLSSTLPYIAAIIAILLSPFIVRKVRSLAVSASSYIRDWLYLRRLSDPFLQAGNNFPDVWAATRTQAGKVLLLRRLLTLELKGAPGKWTANLRDVIEVDEAVQAASHLCAIAQPESDASAADEVGQDDESNAPIPTEDVRTRRDLLFRLLERVRNSGM